MQSSSPVPFTLTGAHCPLAEIPTVTHSDPVCQDVQTVAVRLTPTAVCLLLGIC